MDLRKFNAELGFKVLQNIYAYILCGKAGVYCKIIVFGSRYCYLSVISISKNAIF